MRVVVVNYDGREDTLRCLDSLRRLDWPQDRLDVVVVDNGSTDGLVAHLKAERPDVRVLEAGENLGFAGGCNLALADLHGVDHVALLNNDAEVDPGWLRPLVEALEGDRAVGAACSKVLFSDPFSAVEVETTTTAPGRGDRRPLGVRLSGIRVGDADVWGRAQFGAGWWGLEHDGAGDHSWSRERGRLWLPVPAAARDGQRAQLRLSALRTRPVVLRSGDREAEVTVGPEPAWYGLALSGPAVRLVDNAGTVLRRDLYGADRAHLQPDDGRYDQPAEVFAWYGGSALLSTDYLRDVGPFDARLFLYYEDLDLSWRGRLRGWRYRYVPASVVHHVHSASSREGSALSQYHGERNRLLVVCRNAPAAVAAGAVARYILSTASYARRDLAAPLLAGQRPRPETVRRRLRAFAAFARMLPPVLADRLGRGRLLSGARRRAWQEAGSL